MLKKCGLFLPFAAIVLCGIGGAAQDSGQDSPSLGDAARQARQQKQQQAKTTPAKSVKPAKVITNEEIPEHAGPDGVSLTSDGEHSSAMAPSGNSEAGKASPEHWKSQIQAQKSQIAALQREA